MQVMDLPWEEFKKGPHWKAIKAYLTYRRDQKVAALKRVDPKDSTDIAEIQSAITIFEEVLNDGPFIGHVKDHLKGAP